MCSQPPAGRILLAPRSFQQGLEVGVWLLVPGKVLGGVGGGGKGEEWCSVELVVGELVASRIPPSLGFSRSHIRRSGFVVAKSWRGRERRMGAINVSSRQLHQIPRPVL